ncbi:MAG TPA: GNAT family N-acetyltransferase [Chlamydiales bacterium]
MEIGLPSLEFFSRAWASEPLTTALRDVSIPLVLPAPEQNISLVAIAREENRPQITVGQCSMNHVATYWDHVERLDLESLNFPTCIFAAIHKKAAKAEQEYLHELGIEPKNTLHNAGIAVLPEYRGYGLGIEMAKHQIELCKQLKSPFLFCETTNRNSAHICKQLGFISIAEYSYKSLADELSCRDLNKLDDFFTIWRTNI